MSCMAWGSHCLSVLCFGSSTKPLGWQQKEAGKWMLLFSSEHGSIATGKAWWFSVFFFFFCGLNSNCIASFLSPLILQSYYCPFMERLSFCCLTEGCDVGATTRGHYDTSASRSNGDVLWSGGAWIWVKQEKSEEKGICTQNKYSRRVVRSRRSKWILLREDKPCLLPMFTVV